MSPRSTCDGEGGRGGEERTKHVCENLFKTRRNHPGRARRADVARRGRGRAARASRTHQLGLHGSRRHLSPFARPRARVEVRELFRPYAGARLVVRCDRDRAGARGFASRRVRRASARAAWKVDARVGEVELWRLEGRRRVARACLPENKKMCLSPFDGSRLSQPDSTFPNRACSTNGGHLAAAPRCIGV